MMVKRWLPWVIKGGLSFGLIAWVLSGIDFADAWARAQALDPLMLAASVALMVVQTALGALRWGMVVRALSARLDPLKTLGVYYIGVFFSIVLPGAVGGDAVRMWFARRSGLELHAAINSVMLERASTVYGLVLLVCLTQPILLTRVPDLPGVWVFPVLMAVATLGILVLATLDRLPVALHRWKVVRWLVHLATDTRRLFFHPGWSLGTLAVALVGHVNLSLAVYVLAVGLGIDLHVLDCLVLVPPVILVITLPISIAGWGVRESAMVTAFAFVGVSGTSSVVLSVLFGLVTMVAALPGGLVFLAMRHPIAEMEGDTAKVEQTAGS
ncbi:MAG: lysylphosphatidylglycerol synthase transmembrane domain-containing protein [Solirubrobacterales bacterium]